MRRLGIFPERPYFLERDRQLSRWILAQRDRPPDGVVEQALRWGWADRRHPWTWAEVDKSHLPAQALCLDAMSNSELKPHRPPMLRPICAASSSGSVFWIGACHRCRVNYWCEPSSGPIVPDGRNPGAVPMEVSIEKLRELLEGTEGRPGAMRCNGEGVLLQRFIDDKNL